MHKNGWWAWAVKNSVVVICWTALAVYFGKWWIALFAVLLTSDIKHVETTEKENNSNESED